MGLTLDLPLELANALKDEASRRGISLSEYAVSLLAEARPATTSVQTGSDLVAYWRREGVIGSSMDIADSQKHARELREAAQKRS